MSTSLRMKEEVEITTLQRTASAFVGALITSLVVTPLDVVKTRMQAQMPLSATTSTCCGDLIFCEHFLIEGRHRNTIRFNGTLDGLVKIVRYEGASNLWRGLPPSLVMALPATVIYFVGYENLRRIIEQSTETNNLNYVSRYSPLLAGSLARAVAATTISPLELIRTRLQTEKTKSGAYLKVFSDVGKMVSNQGFSSLWRGLSPTLWRDVPFSGIYWMGYETFGPIFNEYIPGNTTYEKFLISFLSGASSGAIAAALTTPFDVAKTRRQVGLSGDLTSSTPGLLKEIYRGEGVKGLLTGIVPRILKTAPACAIMISTYELGKIYFGEKHSDDL